MSRSTVLLALVAAASLAQAEPPLPIPDVRWRLTVTIAGPPPAPRNALIAYFPGGRDDCISERDRFRALSKYSGRLVFYECEAELLP